MKTITNIIITFLILGIQSQLTAQVKIGDNPSSINSSALLEMESTTQGLLLPRMTAGQRTSIASPSTGLMIFQTDVPSGFYFYNGLQWRIVLADSSTNYTSGRNLDIVGKGVGVTKTTTIIFDNIVAEQFDINDALYFDVSDPVDYAGGDLTIIVDFITTGSESGKSVRWEIDYKIHAPEEAVSGSTGTLDSGDLVLNSAQYHEVDAIFSIPEAELIGAEAIHFKLIRTAIVAGSDPSNNPAVIHVNIRYNSIR